MDIFYTTINGKLSGRASYGHRSKRNAEKHADAQNDRAVNLGIKARYSVASCKDGDIVAKEIRD